MTRQQIIAARAARVSSAASATPSTRPIGPVSTDPRARVQTPVSGLNARKNRKATRLTATQKNSQGRRSEWTYSPFEPRGGWR